MFKILVATDGSACANKAVDYAGLLVRRIGDAEITILSVIDMRIINQASIHPTALTATLIKDLEEAASEVLQEAQQRLSWVGKEVSVVLERGIPAQTICDQAETGTLDLIVMGSRGHGRIAGILLGSVSDRVVHLARVPVLIVHARDCDEV